MRYLSTFSGIGGFELGIQQAYENNNSRKCRERSRMSECVRPEWDSSNSEGKSWKDNKNYPICIGFSEIDKYAIETYQSHFNHKNYGDITKIKTEDLPDFDLLVGGFPCQAFSIAGKRKGFEDTRGTMFFELARILRDKQPRLFVFENVKGLLSHDSGHTFKTIISTIDELGYDCQWQVLNSKNHGVPQNRERVFIIGHLRGTSRPKVFPIGQNDKENTESREVCTSATVSTRTGSTAGGQQFIANTLDANYAKGNSSTKESHTPRTEVVQGMKIRRLTPTECERLQGFPDNWTIGSDTQGYKQCGNAVTVNVIKDIFEKILC